MRRLAATYVGIALGGAVLVVAVLSLAGYPVKPVWFAATALAIAAVALVLRKLGDHLATTDWPQYDAEAEQLGAGTARRDQRVLFVSTWLQDSIHNPDTWARRIQPVVAVLVTERLARRHGVDAAAEPEAARGVVGDWLWELVTDQRERTLSSSELQRVVEAMERL